MGESLLKRLIDALQGSRFTQTRVGEFSLGVLMELDSVTWPNKQEVYNSTVVVMITMMIFAVYLGFWDFLMGIFRGWLYLA